MRLDSILRILQWLCIAVAAGYCAILLYHLWIVGALTNRSLPENRDTDFVVQSFDFFGSPLMAIGIPMAAAAVLFSIRRLMGADIR